MADRRIEAFLTIVADGEDDILLNASFFVLPRVGECVVLPKHIHGNQRAGKYIVVSVTHVSGGSSVWISVKKILGETEKTE